MINSGEKAMFYLQKDFFERRNNLSPYISLQQLALFSP